MSELKCCPFCGGKAFLDTHRFWDEKAKDFTVQTYGVKCYDCQTGTWQHYRKEDAIKQWNTRTPMANIVEKLEEEKTMAYDKWDGGSSYKAYSQAINIVKQEINNGLE
jgi:Lar family restriction alleviation protein